MRSTSHRFLSAAALVGALAAPFAACSDNGGTGPAPRAVERQVIPQRADTVAQVVGTVVDSPLVVRVLDGAGNPIAGEPVTFLVEGRGVAWPTGDFTDADGYAHTHFTMGHKVGSSLVRAYTDSLAPVAVFHFIALVGPAENLVPLSGDSQRVERATAMQLVVLVTDQYNNPVPSVTVSWTTESGELAPASSITDENGQASVTYTLPDLVQTNKVTAAVSDDLQFDFAVIGVNPMPNSTPPARPSWR